MTTQPTNQTLDLDAYLARIGWGGEVRHDLDTLRGLLAAHMSAIPFENLDVLLGRPIRLDIDSIQAKLVQAKRGGYCFEHVTLFAAALTALGFRPLAHSARVTQLLPRTQSPRTHMFVTVPVGEGNFVLDPGFGGLAPRLPVPLAPDTTASIDGETYSMLTDGPYRVYRFSDGAKTTDAWVSTLEADHPVDFEVANHYVSTHPGSPFVNRLMMRTHAPGMRVSVMNRTVTYRAATAQAGEPPRVVELEHRGQLRRLLIDHFGFDLPQVEHLVVPAVPDWS